MAQYTRARRAAAVIELRDHLRSIGAIPSLRHDDSTHQAHAAPRGSTTRGGNEPS